MSLQAVGNDPDGFKAALGAFASSVSVITTWDERGRPQGATVTAFSSVSIDPLLVLVCVNREARSFSTIVETGRLGVNILDSMSRELSDYCSRPGIDKSLDASWLARHKGWRSPALASALAYLDCTVRQIVQAGTHGIIICGVDQIALSAQARRDEPLLHFRGSYRRLEAVTSRTRPRPLPIILEDLP